MSFFVLDIGSSSLRGILYDTDLQLIPQSLVQIPYHFQQESKGQADYNPQALLALLEQVISRVLEHPSAKTIQAVGMASFAGNLVGLDSAVQAVTPLLTYADRRSRAVLNRLHATHDTLQRTGARLHSAYYPAQIHWLIKQYPEAVYFCDFGTYCYQQWFEQSRMSYTMASWSGLLNRQSRTWDKQWLAELGLSADNFPPLADYHASLQGLSSAYAKKWAFLADVPFFLTIGDGAAAQIGSGALAPQTAALTIGTTSALRMVSHETLPPVPLGGWGYRIDAEQHLLGGALSEGGNLFAWAKANLKLPEGDLESALAHCSPAAHGLSILPTFNGERSPHWQDDAVGTIHGISLQHTGLDILQALLESVALRLALIAKQLDLSPATRIMASGGALHASPVWAQMIANALGLPLYLIDESEITARGLAALIQAAYLNVPLVAPEPLIAAVIEPQMSVYEVYQAALSQQQNLYHRLNSRL